MILGLTGGIGSGKSVVAFIFETLGCAVFNSDTAAKEIYFDETIRPKVVKLLGEESYLSEWQLNKAYISSRIFNDNKLLQKLNAVIHPAVAVAFKKFADNNPDKIIIKETALLFEANVSNQVDKIVLVVAGDALRIKRISKRDGLTKEEIVKKINSQWTQDEKQKRSDFIISNDETQFLTLQVIDILKKVTHA